MSRCKVGEIWDSTLNGQPDGQFRIEHIEPNGNFTGRHGDDAIQGTCKAGQISYLRGSQTYSGKYVGNDKVHGAHSKVARLRVRKVLTDDDDWVGTHTT